MSVLSLVIDPTIEASTEALQLTGEEVAQAFASSFSGGALSESLLGRFAASIAEEVGLPLETVQSGMTSFSTPSSLIIEASGKPIPLIQFNAFNQHLGVFQGYAIGGTVSLLQGNPTAQGAGDLSEAFIARMPDGRLGIFERATKGETIDEGPPRVDRLPIVQKFGPSIAQALVEHPEIWNPILGAHIDAQSKEAEKAIQEVIAARGAQLGIAGPRSILGI
jgi:hypothetical protein